MKKIKQKPKGVNEKMKKQNAVTLVSLVVTIIILIILAGVSINAILGKNGIITIAKEAKQNVEQAQIKEQTELNELYTQISTEDDSIGGSEHVSQSVGNATEEQVLEGVTFSNSKAIGLTGSMPNRGLLNWNPSGNETFSVPAGYYSGGTLSTENAYNSGNSNKSSVYVFSSNFVSSSNITIDISSIPEYKKLTVDDIYLHISGGKRSKGDGTALDCAMTYSYDNSTGIISVNSAHVLFDRWIKFIVVINPTIVIRLTPTSYSSTVLTYDISSYEGYQNLSGNDLVWWFSYEKRTGTESPFEEKLEYDSTNGIITLTGHIGLFSKYLETNDTTFFSLF